MKSKITTFSRKFRSYKKLLPSFSCQKRIKSDIRTTKEQIRLYPLSDIDVHSDIILSLRILKNSVVEINKTV